MFAASSRPLTVSTVLAPSVARCILSIDPVAPDATFGPIESAELARRPHLWCERSLTNGENLDNATSGVVRPFYTETALVDLQRANPRLERRPWNPESCRCPRRPKHPSA